MPEEPQQAANKANVVKDLKSIIALSKRLLRVVEKGEVEIYASYEQSLDDIEEELYDFVSYVLGRQ